MRKFIGLFILLLLLSNCTTKSAFDKTDRVWIDTYEIGDVLTFVSEATGSTHTLEITEKKFDFDFDTFSKFEFFDLYVQDDVNESDVVLIGLTKGTNKVTRFNINLFGASAFSLNIRDVECKTAKSDLCIYEFKVKRKDSSPNDPAIIYWERGKGIISYEAANGDVWTLSE